MKNIAKKYCKHVALAVGLGWCCVGCVNMDLAPLNSASESNVWSSETLAEQTVTGVYNVLYEGAKDGWVGWFDVWSSMMDLDRNWIGGLDFLFATNSSTSDRGSERWWKNYYGGILRANDVISNLPSVPGMDEAKASRLVSECRFLRSWWYYRLNILYGGVPYYTEAIKNTDEAKLARSTQDQIWDYLIQDLTKCIEDSNLPDKYSSSDANYGHITKGAAYALRGKVYMWKKEWQKAADDFEAVKNCGYSLYTADGANSYKQLFKEENERCDEMIFSLQCSSANNGACANNKNGNYGTRSMPDDGTGTGIGWTNYIINPNFVDSYENADGSKFNWDDYIPGYNEMTAEERSVYFLRDDATEEEKAVYADWGADMSKYITPGNEARIKAAYDHRDPRLAMSVITPYSTYLGGRAGVPTEYTMRAPYRDVMAPTYDLQTDVASMVYYVNRKFVGEGLEIMTFYSPIDLPLIRYAEVLLNWAEALNELGDVSGAVEKVNEVRRRAGAQPLNSNAPTTVTGQEDMRQRIMNECHWELVGEDVVFFDEIRWRTWKDLKFSKDSQGRTNGMRQVWGTPTYQYTWGGDNYWVLPIPAREIEMNPNMVQNEGYQ